ncbi:hypothetical protein HDV57DRAFT_159637 [Trichoderma longibrachiatum]|uniref:Uncharacterized protein n=1 Tax=Trichoderma longibrachiatum ATCC 18648 TaxID=983965 RepID=A0A2T4C107_TRILO|nr:hypothetical protein M440DRAFT_1271627 [Trichoderma longibrachiatum ATCC 18648]
MAGVAALSSIWPIQHATPSIRVVCIVSKQLIPPVIISRPSPRHCKLSALMLQVIRVRRAQLQSQATMPQAEPNPIPKLPPLYPNSMQASSTEPNMPFFPLTESFVTAQPPHQKARHGKGMEDEQKRGQLRCMHQPVPAPAPAPAPAVSDPSLVPLSRLARP